MEDFTEDILFDFGFIINDDVLKSKLQHGSEIWLKGKFLNGRREIAVISTPEFIEAMTNHELCNVISEEGICSSGTGMKLDDERRNELFGENKKIAVINYP